MPESFTFNAISPFSSTALISILPFSGVYLIAFEMRFSRITSIMLWSIHTSVSTQEPIVMVCFFCLARVSKRSISWYKNGFKATCWTFIFMFLLSYFWISSNCVTIFISLSPFRCAIFRNFLLCSLSSLSLAISLRGARTRLSGVRMSWAVFTKKFILSS